MNTATSKFSGEAEIRRLTQEWIDALRARDPGRMMTNYARDVRVFGLSPPLEILGVDEYKRHWQRMFNSFEGPIGYEVRDESITAGNDVGFYHCLNRISGKTKDGRGSDGTWIRVTVCFKKINGKWVVTHEHASVPFDAQSGKASLDLNP
jgi:ketosteroid isomerase-like protein